MSLSIDIIRQDGGTQPREVVREDWIADYAEKMQAGKKFPPVDVFFDGTDYWLADGFHRVGAAAASGHPEIDATIHQGTRRDAVLFSVGVNEEHGHKRTNEDRRRAIDVLLNDPEWSKWSNREIARQCDVSEGTVRNRREACPSAQITQMDTRLVTRNGVTYEMQTGSIGQRCDVDETVTPAIGHSLDDFSTKAKERGIDPNALNQLVALATGDGDPDERVAGVIAGFQKLNKGVYQKTAEVQHAKNLALKLATPKPVPEGKYGTIVIDPPWPMKKIKRVMAPNQTEDLGYPTMTKEELMEFPVPGWAADDCHLFCWTTEKFEDMAKDLLAHWGFSYQRRYTWHKTVGFQPFKQPKFNGEYVLYGKKGAADFTNTQGLKQVFEGKARQHSRKPDAFYKMIKDVTDEGRIDIFSREKREGYDQVGNQKDMFTGVEDVYESDEEWLDEDDIGFGDSAGPAPTDIASSAAEAMDDDVDPASDNEGATHNHRAQGTGDNEWYTPARYIEAARAVLGTIDLDPASSEIANRTVQAERFYTAEDDGLTQPWFGNVWLNPPYSQPLITHFMAKLVDEVGKGTINQAIALTHNYTDTAWFQSTFTVATAVCFTRGRVGFLDPDGNRASPTQGQAIFYFGTNVAAFANAFQDVGAVCQAVALDLDATKARLAEALTEVG